MAVTQCNYCDGVSEQYCCPACEKRIKAEIAAQHRDLAGQRTLSRMGTEQIGRPSFSPGQSGSIDNTPDGGES